MRIVSISRNGTAGEHGAVGGLTEELQVPMLTMCKVIKNNVFKLYSDLLYQFI